MRRVLVIDDEPEILSLTCRMIKNLGFLTLEASSSVEACTIFKEKKPGIVITDLQLESGIDGVALCSRFLYEDKTTVVIAMSGYFNRYDKMYALQVGFTDFLQKPVSLEELGSALHCAFDRRSRWCALG
jgi:DNA-binding response OmpR family regulator